MGLHHVRLFFSFFRILVIKWKRKRKVTDNHKVEDENRFFSRNCIRNFLHQGFFPLTLLLFPSPYFFVSPPVRHLAKSEPVRHFSKTPQKRFLPHRVNFLDKCMCMCVSVSAWMNARLPVSKNTVKNIFRNRSL